MGSDTKIEWTDASWTPIRARAIEIQNDGSGKERVGWHCQKVSAGCKNCYAEPINRRLGTGLEYKPGHLRRGMADSWGLSGDVSIFLDERMLLAPLKWRKPRRIFVCSMTDLFADFVTDAMIDRVFAVMALCPRHTFQVLTKRPERMRAYFEAISADPARDAQSKLAVAGLGGDLTLSLEAAARLEQGPLPNVWLGVSAEDQEAADARVPVLLATPAAVRFVSAEPLLGPVDLTPHLLIYTHEDAALLEGTDEGPPPVLPFRDPATTHPDDIATPRLNWVIVGGESGPGARPMHPDWARQLRDQCADADVPFFFKQWGEWAPQIGAVEGWAIKDDPEISRFVHLEWGPETGKWGEQFFPSCWDWTDGNIDERHCVSRIGKKAAGRLLDGVTHDGVPA